MHYFFFLLAILSFALGSILAIADEPALAGIEVDDCLLVGLLALTLSLLPWTEIHTRLRA